jgi:hypothetical protein
MKEEKGSPISRPEIITGESLFGRQSGETGGQQTGLSNGRTVFK